MRTLEGRHSTLSALMGLAVLAGVAIACGPSSSGGGGGGDGDDDAGTIDPPPVFPDGSPPAQCEKIDILFVVDNSGSMGEEQSNLALNFPGFMDVIIQSGLDYRVGITSTGRDYSWFEEVPIIGQVPQNQDGGDNGELLRRCDMTQRWVSADDPDPAATFACAAQLGTSGPSDEMPLAVIKQAFTQRVADGTNAGFLREDALLAIVIITDENDCSYEQSVSLPFGQFLCDSQMEPVASYVSFLDQLTGDRGRWATAVIAGPGPGTCSSEFGSAAAATRLVEFVGLTGDNAVMSSICEGDLTAGLQAALETFDSACESFPPIE